jgi:hypothetical protein
VAEQRSTSPALEIRKTTKKSNILGPYIPHGLFQTKGELCAKFGSDGLRNADLKKEQINTQRKKGQNDKKVHKGKEKLGPYIPYGLLETNGEMCAKFDSDRFRNVDLYKVQTHTLTFASIY